MSDIDLQGALRLVDQLDLSLAHMLPTSDAPLSDDGVDAGGKRFQDSMTYTHGTCTQLLAPSCRCHAEAAREFAQVARQLQELLLSKRAHQPETQEEQLQEVSYADITWQPTNGVNRGVEPCLKHMILIMRCHTQEIRQLQLELQRKVGTVRYQAPSEPPLLCLGAAPALGCLCIGSLALHVVGCTHPPFFVRFLLGLSSASCTHDTHGHHPHDPARCP